MVDYIAAQIAVSFSTSARRRSLARLAGAVRLAGAAGLALLLWLPSAASLAVEQYLLGPGDVLHISVFKNSDLSVDARVSESGSIGYPLVGSVPVAGLTLSAAEQKIAQMLRDGGFVLDPQVNILLTTAVGNQVDVLGQVNKPGRYPIEGAGGHLAGMLAEAGGIAQTGADVVVVSGVRNGQPFHREIDLAKISQIGGGGGGEVELKGGDTVFVNRAPMFFIYGQVQHPGQYRLDKGMTVMQAVADGGGVTGKGTTRGIVLHRKDASGKVKQSKVDLQQELQDQDVLYVKESFF